VIIAFVQVDLDRLTCLAQPLGQGAPPTRYGNLATRPSHAFPPASWVSISEVLGIRICHGFLVGPTYLGVLAQYSRYSSPNTLARCCSSVLTIIWAIPR